MARTRTLAQLRAEVRDRADIENSLHITDTQIDRYVNQSGAALHAMMVETAEDWFVTQEGTTAPAPTAGAGENATEIACQATFYKVLAVEAKIGGRKTRLQRFQWQDHALLTDDASVTSVGPFFYRVVGSNYIITPPLPTGTSVRVYYIPAFTDLSVDASTLDGVNGWEEWVVLDAAIKCMLKEESDPAGLMAERNALLERIKQQMKTRDVGRPDKVQDVVGRDWDTYEIRAGRIAT